LQLVDDTPRVLRGFLHVLKRMVLPRSGIRLVMRAMLEQSLDIDDVLYQSGAGPILVRDVIYGWHVEIERTGRDFYAHKTGFTARSLTAILEYAGFAQVVSVPAIGVRSVGTCLRHASRPAARGGKRVF
jgi:hypothetical protein